MNPLRSGAICVLLLLASFSLAVFPSTGKIAVLLDAGRGDMSFNDMGLKGATDAAQRFDLELAIVQSASAVDFLPSLRNLARSGSYDVIISFGFLLADAISQAADEFPLQKFVTVGGVIPGKANVRAILFRENEMSALVGALAGMTAALGGYPHTGMVLGVEIPVLYHFEAGYRFGMTWGLSHYEENTGQQVDVGLLYTYTGTFKDIAVGKVASEAMLAQGAASIYNVAGALGLGDLEAVTEAHQAAGTTFGPPYYFGVDANQDYLGGGFHGLASAMKRIDVATAQAVESVVEGRFQGGMVSLGLSDGGVGLSDLQDLDEFIEFGVAANAISQDDVYWTVANWANNRATVPSWIWDAIDTLEAGILSGTIAVPTADTRAEMEALRALYPLQTP